MRIHRVSLLAAVAALCLACLSQACAVEAPAVPPIRVAVCSFDSLNEDPRLKKLDQREYLASLVEERLRELPYLQVLPRQKAGTLAKDADFTLRGDYLPLATGRYRLSLRLLGRDGSAAAAWSDEAASWRAMVMDSRELEPDEMTGDRQAPGDRRSLLTALTADVARELLRHYTLRQLGALHGSPKSIVASIRMEPKQDAYKTGDLVSIIVTPEAGCHVTALHVRAGNSIRVISPVAGQESSAAGAKGDYTVGGQALPIRSIMPLGAEESRVLIFLTRDPLKLSPEVLGARTPEEQLRLLQGLVEALGALPADAWSDREMSLRIVAPGP